MELRFLLEQLRDTLREAYVKFLFWNVGGRTVDKEIIALVADERPDFLVLAEYKTSTIDLLRSMVAAGIHFYLIPSIACDRITIYSNIVPNHIHHRREASRFTIKEIRSTGTKPILLCLVHLLSKLHASDDDQLYGAISLKNAIEKAETEAGHKNTIVFGDFNMNPFDKGMLFAAALNAISCLRTAERESRMVQGQVQNLFYNPTWNLLGDFIEGPGTYFHKSPSSLSLYWNMLDQVIMRPELARGLDRDSLKIIRAAGGTSFITDEGLPSVSDHLPIVFSIDIPC